MKVIAHVHGYPPAHNAGAEYALHGLLKWLVTRGHDCTVWAFGRAVSGTYDGVEVINGKPSSLRGLYEACDIAITHLDNTKDAMQMARTVGKPLAHYVHNHLQIPFHGVTLAGASLLIHNSAWVRDNLLWQGPQCVLHPPINPADYRVTPGDKVTLINLTENKGSRLFWRLAEMLPEVPFLAVRGSYGVQDVPREVPGNVTLLSMTPNITEVYRQTRLVLMPSEYESWGRVAMEAACSGIPTLACPTEGLRECLGDAGIYFDRRDVDGWAHMIKALMRPGGLYTAVSGIYRKRFEAYHKALMKTELPECEQAMQQAIADFAGYPDAVTAEEFDELPAPRVFYCERFPNLLIPALGVRFRNHECVTRSARAVRALLLREDVVEVR